MISVFEVLGGMALFLFGVRFLSAGMEKLAGHRLQEWLDRMTNRPFRGAVFGAGATALLQSSSLLMVTMIGLINANLMTLEAAVGVMMGQEIGTTLTAQIIAFKIGDLAFLIIAVGLVMYEFLSDRRWQRVGQVILGFGILFLGMKLMSGALKELANLTYVQDWLVSMGQNYLLGILAGTLATAIIQSSSAVTGLVVAMGISQTISLSGAIAILLGANIGTTITGLIASLRLSRASRQASMAQILINIIGVLIFIPFIPQFTELVEYTSSNLPRQIANAHTIFNVATSVILFPLIGRIARWSERLVPEIEIDDDTKLTKYIDESQYRFPIVAMAEAKRELSRVGDITADMINLSRRVLLRDDMEVAVRVVELENELINPLCATLEGFIIEMEDSDLTERDKRRFQHLRELVSDVERVSDLTVALVEIAIEEGPLSSKLRGKAIDELDDMFKQTHRIYKLSLKAVSEDDRDLAVMANKMEDEMDRRYWKARKKLSKRPKGKKKSSDADALHLEILRRLERISDRADSIGDSVVSDAAGG